MTITMNWVDRERLSRARAMQDRDAQLARIRFQAAWNSWNATIKAPDRARVVRDQALEEVARRRTALSITLEHSNGKILLGASTPVDNAKANLKRAEAALAQAQTDMRAADLAARNAGPEPVYVEPAAVDEQALLDRVEEERRQANVERARLIEADAERERERRAALEAQAAAERQEKAGVALETGSAIEQYLAAELAKLRAEMHQMQAAK